MAARDIKMLDPCKGIYPSEGIIDRYFLRGWHVKPLGWHQHLLQEESSFKPGTIRYHIHNQALHPTSLQLQGWAFLQDSDDQQLYLFADYGTAGQLALPVKQSRRDVKKSLKISNKAVGFNATIPRSHSDEPLLTVTIGMPENRVQIWQDPSADG